MKFEALYFKDRLTVVNPEGAIGVVTLWSKVDYVMERFRQARVDLNPSSSPIAVFGNLYGNGLREMLRNLLYNPQIRVLLICGHNRSGSFEELKNFFELGLEPLKASLVQYRPPESALHVSPARIRQTKRIIDDLVFPKDFETPPRLEWLGDPQEVDMEATLLEFFSTWQPLLPQEFLPRHKIPLPEVEMKYFPSNPRGHQVVRDTPLEAWRELLYLLSRFGRIVTLTKGDRLELQNVKVIVEKPDFEKKDKLLSYNIEPRNLKRYQADILRAEFWSDETQLRGQVTLPLPDDTPIVELRPDVSYSYSHRLHQQFDIDGLVECAVRLQNDPEDRKAYFSLWDNRKDLKAISGHPCFVSLFFRKFEERLTLTATFRTHNAVDGWLLNCYGLMAIQKWVADRVNMPIGAITVISHSISIDPRELDRAMLIIGKRRFKVRLDPMGYFRITLDGSEILVEHRFEDVTLKEYRGKKAERLQHEIARDVALSDINHAIYLGRQLARAEAALKAGREFVQE